MGYPGRVDCGFGRAERAFVEIGEPGTAVEGDLIPCCKCRVQRAPAEAIVEEKSSPDPIYFSFENEKPAFDYHRNVGNGVRCNDESSFVKGGKGNAIL